MGTEYIVLAIMTREMQGSSIEENIKILSKWQEIIDK